MKPPSELLPISTTIAPDNAADVAAALRTAFDQETPVYPIGGGTSLDYGLPATRPGIGLMMNSMRRVIDYPARDMTITAEAGITMVELAKTLAAEKQRLPVDVPHPELATLGGVVATNWNGPRRYASGPLRDFVIGISAVDGCGMAYKGGGRVVKNVAGYDFCKLLTGSLGTLGVITQLTLKLRPIPEVSRWMLCQLQGVADAERVLAALNRSPVTPAAIELLLGPAWDELPAFTAGSGAALAVRKPCLAVALEGTEVEVRWMSEKLSTEWWDLGISRHETVIGAGADDLWRRIAQFAAEPAPLVLRSTTVASHVTRVIAAIREVDPEASIQAHAGTGIVHARLSKLPGDGISRAVPARLQPVAAAGQGNLTVIRSEGGEATVRSVWGGTDVPFSLMADVRRQFDPKQLLNPGRFVYR